MYIRSKRAILDMMEFLYAAQMKSSTVQGVQGLVIRLCGVIQAVLAINASRQIAEGRATISASWIFIFNNCQSLPVQMFCPRESRCSGGPCPDLHHAPMETGDLTRVFQIL
jgi:hypothetical protein